MPRGSPPVARMAKVSAWPSPKSGQCADVPGAWRCKGRKRGGLWRHKLLRLSVPVAAFTPRRAPSMVAWQGGAPSGGSGLLPGPAPFTAAGQPRWWRRPMALYLPTFNSLFPRTEAGVSTWTGAYLSSDGEAAV